MPSSDMSIKFTQARIFLVAGIALEAIAIPRVFGFVDPDVGFFPVTVKDFPVREAAIGVVAVDVALELETIYTAVAAAGFEVEYNGVQGGKGIVAAGAGLALSHVCSGDSVLY